MKNIALIMMNLTVLGFAACKDGDNKSSGQKIIGRWKFESSKTINTNSKTGSIAIHMNEFSASDYMDFRTDEMVYSHFEGVRDDTSEYKIIANKIIVESRDTLTIIALTDHQLITNNKFTAGETTLEFTDTFKRLR